MKSKSLKVACFFSLVAFLAFCFQSTTICIVFLIIAFIAFILHLIERVSEDEDEPEKPEEEIKRGDYVYLDYESLPMNWAHNDSIYAIKITRIYNSIITDWNELNTDEGWEIEYSHDSEPTGSCMEHIEREERRKNGLSFHYDFYWKGRCWWYPNHDIIRMLFDEDYFSRKLKQAEEGDVLSQTLVGSCYGHNGNMSRDFVEQSKEKALYWWNKAADKGFTPAMIELAIHYWIKGEYKKAKEWNEKSGRRVFIINQQFPEVLEDD